MATLDLWKSTFSASGAKSLKIQVIQELGAVLLRQLLQVEAPPYILFTSCFKIQIASSLDVPPADGPRACQWMALLYTHRISNSNLKQNPRRLCTASRTNRLGQRIETCRYSLNAAPSVHASIACLLLYEDYVWVSLGNVKKAKQSIGAQHSPSLTFTMTAQSGLMYSAMFGAPM